MSQRINCKSGQAASGSAATSKITEESLKYLKMKFKILKAIKSNPIPIIVCFAAFIVVFKENGFTGILSLFIALFLVAVFWWIVMTAYHKLKD